MNKRKRRKSKPRCLHCGFVLKGRYCDCGFLNEPKPPAAKSAAATFNKIQIQEYGTLNPY